MSVYVFHNRYGKGVLTGIDAGRASVEFEDSAVGVKKFPYPDAFESFLCYEDEQKQGGGNEGDRGEAAGRARACKGFG